MGKIDRSQRPLIAPACAQAHPPHVPCQKIAWDDSPDSHWRPVHSVLTRVSIYWSSVVAKAAAYCVKASPMELSIDRPKDLQ